MVRPPKPGSLGYNAIAGAVGATVGMASGSALTEVGANTLGTAITNASNNAVNALSNSLNSVSSGIGNAVSAVGLGAVGTTIASAGSSVAAGVSAVASGASAVGTAIGGFLAAAAPIVGVVAVGGAIGVGIGWGLSKLFGDN